nr:metallophosphoesterase [uncultured Limosilactobacillus sp.]
MKILLVSDNHGDKKILETIADHFAGQVDEMFHCGDSNIDASRQLMKRYSTVIGNTDWGLDYPEVVTRHIKGQVITVTHGHLYQVNRTLTPLLLLAQETNADVVAYGHTHQLAVTQRDQRLFINPGSISLPRGQYANIGGTFAIVEATTDQFNVQYYDRNLKPIPKLKFIFHRN